MCVEVEVHLKLDCVMSGAIFFSTFLLIFLLYFGSIFLNFRDPGATFLGILEVLGPSWRLLGCQGGFGEHFGSTLGGFWEDLGRVWGAPGLTFGHFFR